MSTVTQLLNEAYPGLDTPRLREIKELLVDLRLAANSEEDWKKIYHMIFGGPLGNEVHTLLKSAGRSFPDYTDPDTTYEEDARAWMYAFEGMFD